MKNLAMALNFRFAIAALAIFFANSAFGSPDTEYANFLSGNTLLEICTSDAPTDDGFCLAYVMGAAEMGMTVEQRGSGLKDACIPRGVTPDQFIDVVVKYLKENPEKRHFGAAISVWAAIAKAFACA